MNRENIVVDKSYKFAISIVNLYKYLKDEKKEFVISKQILRSGTSIGANVNESQSAESKMDFIHKLGIAAKETRETEYWLNLLKETNYIDEETNNLLIKECKSLLNIINSIIITTKGKIDVNK